MIRLAFAAVVVLAAGAAAAQTPPEGLAWMALRDLNEPHFDLDDPTNHPAFVTEVPAGMLVPVDVTRDGATDWLVDYSAAEDARWCGTGGCRKILYVSTDEGGLKRVFDNQALGFQIDRRDGAPVVAAWVHHVYCGGEPDCHLAWRWDEAAGALVPADDATRRAGDFVLVDDED